MKEITEKRFMYSLEVLPPLLMGRDMVYCFLKHFDHNTEIVKVIDRHKFTDLFVQGEGYDKHRIYACTKGKYYLLGETKREWETESFRYDDVPVFVPGMIEKKLKEVTA